MTTDVKLLPLPGPHSDVRYGYYWEDMEAYARANMEPLIAENERLRKLVQGQDAALGRRPCAGLNAEGKPRCLQHADALARAERLAEALREVDDYLAEREDVIDGDDGAPEANDEMRLRRVVSAALDQEGGKGGAGK